MHAVPFGGQNGQDTVIDIDRAYVAHEPQRDADDSGLNFTWGARPTTVGSWGTSPGWKVGGVDTATIPKVVTASRDADAVEVLTGTVNVDAADQGAWTLQIDNGATVNVASGRTLQVIENVSNSAINVNSGGNLVVGGTVVTPTVGGSGTVTFANGTLRLDHGSIGALATTSDGTVSNARDVTVGKVTLGAGNKLIKQRAGTLVLTQSGGANTLAATSIIEPQFGSVAGVNNTTTNAFGSASVNVNGGGVTLSASAGSSVAFNNAVTVSKSGTIRAAQVSGALAGQTVTLGGTNGMTIASGQTGTLETADGYTLNVAGAVSGAGTLAVGDGAQVNLNGNVTSAFLEFRGDASGVSVGGSLAPTNSYKFVPTNANPHMVIGFNLPSSAGAIIDGGLVDGSVQMNGTASYTGVTHIISGTLRAVGGSLAGDFDSDSDVDGRDFLLWQRQFPTLGASDLTNWKNNYGSSGGGGGSLPAGSPIQFEGTAFDTVAVVEFGDSSLAGNIGTGGGQFSWVGAGGFAAIGPGTHTLTFNGGSSLNWSSATTGFNGQVLQLNSPFATGRVKLTNNINLENDTRIVEVSDNLNSVDDVAEISGIISSSPGGSDKLVVRSPGPGPFLAGHLVLSGANSFSTLEIGESTVEAQDGVGLPSTANLRFASAVTNDLPAVYATHGTFTRNIGTGAGEVYWESDPLLAPGTGGGFAAIGGDLTVTLEGGATLLWADANTGFNGTSVQLGSNVATGVVTLTNNVDGGGANREFETFDNPLVDTDHVVLAGNYTNFGNWRVDGDGEVVTTGNVQMNTNAVLVNNNFAGTLKLVVEGSMTVGNNMSLDVSGANVFVNGTASVDNDIQDRVGNTLGGSGTIFMVDNDNDGQGNQRALIQNGGTLAPGADFDSVGALTFDLTAGASDSTAGQLVLQNGAVYEMEFENNGGVQSDSVLVTSSNSSHVGLLQLGEAIDQSWTLNLDALSDLTGLISGSDQFNLLTWNGNIDFAMNGTVFGPNTSGTVANVILSSADFDLTGASVHYEVANDYSGRVFVTGLAIPSGITAAGIAVPEPSSCVVAALAAVASLFYRRRVVAL